MRISHAGHRVQDEIRRTRAIVAKFRAKVALRSSCTKDADLLEELEMLNMLLISHKCHLNALNLFRIDRKLLLKMAGAVLSYIVITMELNS